MPMRSEQSTPASVVAYFSMEVGIIPEMPTYSGGLGVLAGDTLRGAADLGVPMVGITLLHRKGHFHQVLDGDGNQSETPVDWSPGDFLERIEATVRIDLEGRSVRVGAWRHTVRGVFGHEIPVLFLDTSLPENDIWDQALTDRLYIGDRRYRLCQEVVLGMGGVAMLRALGYERVRAYHMNEGHSALLALALLEETNMGTAATSSSEAERDAIRELCVFTTHTPVAAGHEVYPAELSEQVLGHNRTTLLKSVGCFIDGALNLTHMALVFSRYINGVSMRHEEISRGMFPNYPINSITNGVHAVTWTSEPFRRLYDRYMPEWRRDNFYLRYAVGIPLSEVQQAHREAKRGLLDEVSRRTGIQLNADVMTLGFARRATAYKRADLLFSDLDKLRRIAASTGGLQIVYAGKAHPQDEGGKAMIRAIFSAAKSLKDAVNVVYLPEYDMGLGALICSGVDLWLNTPRKPHEASGTSGMKAALNGVPSLSVLDGWWIEGRVEGVTGWSVGDGWRAESDPSVEIASLYDKLEHTIIPMFYNRPDGYASVMRWAIALNGSFYNAERMVFQYWENAYLARSML